MRIKWRAGLLLAALLAVWVWLYRVPLVITNGPAASSLPGAQALARWLNASTGREPRTAAPATPVGVRKCLSGAEVLYTQGDCPAGSRERDLTGGTVNVMPSPAGVA